MYSSDDTLVVSLAAHDNTYLLDFTVEHLKLDAGSQKGEHVIADYVIAKVQKYEHENFVKFVGVGLPHRLEKLSPTLCSRLWLEIDIVPLVMPVDKKELSFWDIKNVDEQADSMARKCVT